MMDEKAIHLMFYENGKIKDRTDQSKRVTVKVHWSDAMSKETINVVASEYGKEIHILDTLPLIGNLAYCGFNFVDAINFWRKVSNITINENDKDLINKSKQEIFSLIGYLHTLRNKVVSSEITPAFLCQLVFEFKNFKKLLKLIGIKNVDSKIISRASNLKKIIKKSLGYDENCKIPYDKLIEELNFQIDFFKTIADNICFCDDEDFVILLLRYDLKRCKH